MKISRGRRSAEIDNGKDLGSINVYFPHKDLGYSEKGGINWSACGTKSVAETKKFIKGLEKAIEIYKAQK